MDKTPKFNLPFIMPNQAQKHVTANEAFQRIDTLAQLSVVSSSITNEPSDPEDGDAYILTENATGPLWSQHAAGTIAMSYGGSWQFIAPYPGWRAWDQSMQSILVFENDAWRELSNAAETATSTDRLGINTEPDDNNLFAVKSDFELLSHDDVTPGSGSARKVINKAAPENTASVIFQTAFSARAEMGLTGSDDFALRTSPDGQTFQDAASFDRVTGQASFPSGLAHAASGKSLSLPIFTPGADREVSIYGITTARAPSPRQATITAVDQSILSRSGLNTGVIFLNNFMLGVSMVRIWNTSKSPAQPTWVVRRRTATDMDVLDPASIADWTIGDTIQVGDPEDITPGGVLALDISPMLENIVGAVFPQSGILANILVTGAGGQPAQLLLSPDGSPNSFVGLSLTNGNTSDHDQVILPTPTPSPVSNSNLVFIKEASSGPTIGRCTIHINAVYT